MLTGNSLSACMMEQKDFVELGSSERPISDIERKVCPDNVSHDERDWYADNVSHDERETHADW